MITSVLFADDHLMFREALTMLLELQPDIMVVGQAADGLEAVRMAKAINPQTVLMDIFMPELNGIQATAEIKKFNHGIKVIILSMSATAEHVYQSFKAGADGYLLKDGAGSEIAEAVRCVHTGKRYVSENISTLLTGNYAKYREKSGKDNLLDLLSIREREVLQLVADGKTAKDISETLRLAQTTVETYRNRLRRKLGLSDHIELIKFAIQHGMTDLTYNSESNIASEEQTEKMS